MKISKVFFVVFTCFLLLAASWSLSLAVCVPPVEIAEDPSYIPDPGSLTPIQDAYHFASFDRVPPLTDFTLRLSGELFTEDLFINGGTVTLDGGYDPQSCDFQTKNSTTGILGTITISTGAAKFSGVSILSSPACEFDRDLDGFYTGPCASTAIDCDDTNPDTYPGASEICDGLDNDCDGEIDEGLTPTDADGDGYYAIGSCGAIADDCNDNDPNIYPGALEIPYDGIDQDCNGQDMTFTANELATCGDCHNLIDASGNPTGLDLHYRTSPPDGSCQSCHGALVQNILPGHYGRTVITADNGMTVGAKIACLSCHVSWVEGVGGGHSASHPVWDKVRAVGYANLTCDTCHEDRASFHATDVVHDDRSIDVSCGACHTSDTTSLGSAGTGTLLTDADVDTLHRSNCALCHNYSGDQVDAGLVRLKIQQGSDGTQVGCNDCHGKGDDHVNHDHSGTISISTNCYSCHGEPQVVEVTHSNNCGQCHGSPRTEVRDAIDSGQAECLDCHVGHEHNGITGTPDCMICHNTGDPQVLEIVPLHNNSCAICHESTREPVPDVIASGQADCLSCHVAHEHNFITGTPGCVDCHNTGDPLVLEIVPLHNNSCATCHESTRQSVIDAINSGLANCRDCHDAFVSQHPSTIDHTLLITVTGTTCGNCHSNQPSVPLVDPNDPKVHNSCSSCHDSDNGGLVSKAIGKSFDNPGNCSTCHTGSFAVVHPVDTDHSLPIQLSNDCAGCHSAPPPLVDPNDSTVHDECISCHDADGGLINLAAGNPAPNECFNCHGNDLGSLHPNLSADHAATLGTEFVVVFEAGTHDSAMVGDGGVAVNCNTCHSAQLANVHDNNCALCHSGSPSPYDDGVPWIQGYGCSNTACHTTYHADVTASHWTVEDQCTDCHGASFGDFPPLDTSCANCHASYSPADTLRPVTTSDVQPLYIEPARIEFSMMDNGQVGVGTFYSRIDGGPVQTGSSILVYTVGNHTLEFWGVDQAGNEELPHNTADFTIEDDVTPPVTSSSVVSNYYGNAFIQLAATDDNGSAGVQATYYSLDSGPVQTYQPGSFITVPQLSDTTNYTFEYWSVDWNGNVEPVNTRNFTVHGISTLKLVWGNSDIDGSPCTSESGAAADWTVRFGTVVVATGTDGCPDWSGVNDVLISSGRTYSVTINWYLDGGVNFEDQLALDVAVPTSGQEIRLPY